MIFYFSHLLLNSLFILALIIKDFFFSIKEDNINNYTKTD